MVSRAGLKKKRQKICVKSKPFHSELTFHAVQPSRIPPSMPDNTDENLPAQVTAYLLSYREEGKARNTEGVRQHAPGQAYDSYPPSARTFISPLEPQPTENPSVPGLGPHEEELVPPQPSEVLSSFSEGCPTDTFWYHDTFFR